MPRIELWATVFAGLAGGLAGVLWSGFVTTPWLAGGTTTPGARSPAETAAGVLAGAGLRAAGGAALGFLFWLGWGLIALVGQPWYLVGLLYGGLCWAATIAPALGSWLLRGHGPARGLVAHAVEWLFTCLAIGLLCALSWHRYA